MNGAQPAEPAQSADPTLQFPRRPDLLSLVVVAERVLADTTPGHWTVRLDGMGRYCVANEDGFLIASAITEQDAHALCHFHNDWPALLTEFTALLQ